MLWVPFLKDGGLWLNFVVAPALSGWNWINDISRLNILGNLFLCTGRQIWVSYLWSAMTCPGLNFGVFVGLVWLCEAPLYNITAVFLFCWRIAVGNLVLSLLALVWSMCGAWNIGMEIRGVCLSFNVPWGKEFDVDLISWIDVLTSVILSSSYSSTKFSHLRNEENKTSRLVVTQLSHPERIKKIHRVK